MELVYLWVEDYKNIQKQGFNFSPRFRCEYDEVTKELNIIDKDETGEFYPKNFFGDNINITAIVGENGSGKSSLLNVILDYKDIDNAIFIFRKDDELFYKTNGIEINLIEIKKIDENILMSYFSLSPFIDEKIYNLVEKNLFISIYNYKEKEINKIFNFKDLIFNMIPKMPELLKNEEIQKIFKVNGQPTKLFIEFNPNLENIFNDEITFIKSQAENIEKNGKTIFQLSILNDVVINKIYSLIYLMSEKRQEKIKEKEDWETAIKRLQMPLHNNFGSKENFQKNVQNYINNNNAFNTRMREIDSVLKSIDEIQLSFGIEKINFIDRFSFSDGEFILLFCLDKLLKIKGNDKSIVLLIDEIELFLHPNWQKKFISFLLEVFKDSTTEINFILSSHSPFILSDLPKENIIFLEKGKQVYPFDNGKQTFGANIHTLLSHGFFMKDGLMGEFAKDKIDLAITYLNKPILTKKELYYCETIISIIGEPIIKRQLQKMLDSKRLKKIDEIDKIYDEIEFLKHRIEILRKNS